MPPAFGPGSRRIMMISSFVTFMCSLPALRVVVADSRASGLTRQLEEVVEERGTGLSRDCFHVAEWGIYVADKIKT